MITVENFDDANIRIFKSDIEIHQSISSSRCIPINNIDLRSIPYRNENRFSEPNSTATTLNTSLENKIEELNFRKEVLLKNRNRIFNSFMYRFFSLGRDKINIIDKELDKIEEKIYCLRKPEFQKEILLAKDLIKRTNKNLSKHKLEIL